MRILGSNMIFSSDHSFNQMDLSLEEKTEEQSVRLVNQNNPVIQSPTSQSPTSQNSIRQRPVNQNPGNESIMMPQIIVDRVSLSQKENFEYQSSYRENVASTSYVETLETGGITNYENQFAVEKLVGGVIDKNVIINKIQREEDIQISGRERSGPDVSDKRDQNIQAGMVAVESYEMKLMKTDIHFEDANMKFASTGEVVTEDGRVINFSLDMSLDRSFLSRTEQDTTIARWREQINLTDPLVISMDGKAPQLSNATFEFDLDSDGDMENISFVKSGSGFLSFDKNGDNIINNGSELFGPGTGNGFDELAAYDEDQNNWIDENDSIFSKLSVWTKDENGEDLLVSLKDAGVGAISLENSTTMFNMTESDNSLQGQLKSTGVFLFENGNVGSMHQVDLADRTIDKTQTPQPDFLAAQSVLASDNRFQASSLQSFSNEPEPLEIPNPIQELIDRVDKLKKEMEDLLKNSNPLLNKVNKVNQDKFSNLKSHTVFDLKFDTSSMLFGYNGSILHYRRYAY